MRDYTEIEAWRMADDLAVAIYQCTKGFPRDEVYGLDRGSLTETQYCVHLANRLSEEEFDALSQIIKAVFARLHGLIKAVQSEIRKQFDARKSPGRSLQSRRL
jgi:hypothetical protein